MIPFSVYNPLTGEILRSGYVPNEESLVLQNNAGEETLRGSSKARQYVVGGALVDMGARPDKNHVFDYATKAWGDPRNLATTKEMQIALIDEAFEVAAQTTTAGYPPTERSTWSIQQSEVLAWGQNPLSPTPFLDGIALARGIGVIEMRQKTLDNVNQFLAKSQRLIGKRQRLRDRIDAATTKVAVLSVTWPA